MGGPDSEGGSAGYPLRAQWKIKTHRDAEPASWLAGGKRIASDRIEWVIIADQATAAAALQNGEVDWLELPLPDIVPMLRRNRNK